MRIFLLTVLLLLVLSLAGLEMVMSAVPDEQITPAEIRGSASLDHGQGARLLLCDRPVQDAGTGS